ncbi:GMC oxidoreductase-domain-containing protein [Annulohypoxylon stygium]|nr:GMC oxidoreductase-domain-containing protein [Annulohypoxylon stygium]
MAVESKTFDVVIVLVLEIGQDVSELPVPLMQAVMTPAANTQLHKTPLDWDFKTAPQESLGGREISVPQGKSLGGSTALNGLLFTSSAKAVVDGWAELGNPGWEWSAFSESLAKTYTVAKAPPSSTKSSTEGPLKLAFAEDYTDGWPKVWADTIEALGYPGAQNPLTSQSPGGLMIPDTVDPVLGIRSYAVNAYLTPEIRARANLTVLTGVEVNKVLVIKPENGDAAATGVKITNQTTGVSETITARREVIISARVFGSPKVLELSGIGDAQRLGASNVIIDNPGVGENLQNHPMATLTFEVVDSAPETKDAFINAARRQDMGVLGGAMQEYMERHTGPFASSGVTSAAQLPLPGLDTSEGKKDLEAILSKTETGDKVLSPFAPAHEKFIHSILSSTSEASGYYLFGPAYAAYAPDGTDAPPPMDRSEESYITIVVFLAHPLSRGSVHLVGSGADQKLVIDPKFLSHPLDLEIMARHIQFIDQKLVTAGPMAQCVKPGGKRAEGAPEAGALKDFEVAKKFIKERAVGAHHSTGTCSMLPREMGGVVDPHLRVYGTANLRVCDASVIPLTPRANPQATVYAVAEHAATIIKNTLFSQI